MNDTSVVTSEESVSTLGFWIYLMTDCVLFASLFAVYAVLHGNTFGGAGAASLFHLPYVLTETLILLTSSFSAGMGLLAAKRRSQGLVIFWFSLTMLLGTAFLGMELMEFSNLMADGNGPARSGFMSAFFTLVGTHGLHIFTGLIWMSVLLVKVAQRGLTDTSVKRLALASMFWHFLDLIWIFIFTIVYLMGALS